MAAVVLACALASSGCLVLAIATTKNEVIAEDAGATRASHDPASTDGAYCFTDRRLRTRKRASVSSWYRVGGAFNALLFGLAAGSSTGDTQAYVGAIALDGLLAFLYHVAWNGHESTSNDWQETTEVQACAH